MKPSAVYGIGECGMCGGICTFDAHKVITIRALGMTFPVCRSCLDIANHRRAYLGLPLLQIPPGAYEPEPS